MLTLKRSPQARLLLVIGFVFSAFLVSFPDQYRTMAARPIPILGPMLPLFVLGCIFSYKPPLVGARLVHDSEIDLIFAIPVIVVAFWVLLSGPTWLGDHYWLWRPDVHALTLFYAATVAMIFGVRSALSFLPSLAGIDIAQLPIFQLLTIGDSPSISLVTFAAAIFGALPLLLTRSFRSLRNLWAFISLLIVALTSVEIARFFHWPAREAGTFGALAGFAVVFVIKSYPLGAPIFRYSAPVPFMQRLVLVAIFSTTLSLACTYSLNAASYREISTSHILPSLEFKKAYSTPDGFSLSTATIRTSDGTWLVTLAQTPTRIILLGHPDDGSLQWPVARCPSEHRLLLNGINYVATRFEDPESLARYVRISWSGNQPGTIFRIGLIASEGVKAGSSPFPLAVADSKNDSLRTLERLVRSAKLACAAQPLAVEPVLIRAAQNLAFGASK